MSLYEKDKYLANIDYLISSKIREYDMREAGFNLIKEYNLLSDKKIKYLSSLDKKQRTIQIGIYMRDDQKFNKDLTSSFKKARKIFFEMNNIEDNEVLSIKKDAVFLINKTAITTVIGKYIEFRNKNTYTSYHYINGYEFYYNKDIIDVKGISDSTVKKHSEGFLIFLNRIMKLIEDNDSYRTFDYLKKFVRDYKQFNLNTQYYKEFNNKSLFAINKPNSKCIFYSDTLNKADIKYTNIGYNYSNYILYFIQNFM